MQLIQQMLPQMIVEDGPHRGEIFTIPMNTQTLFIGREVSFHKNAVSVQGGSRQIKRKRSARERKQNNERKKVRRKGVRSSKRIKKQTSGANTSATATANKDKRGNSRSNNRSKTPPRYSAILKAPNSNYKSTGRKNIDNRSNNRELNNSTSEHDINIDDLNVRTHEVISLPNDDEASSLHCVINVMLDDELNDLYWTIRDVGSTNGTIVNKSFVQQGDVVELSIGDIVQCGKSKFTINDFNQISIHSGPHRGFETNITKDTMLISIGRASMDVQHASASALTSLHGAVELFTDQEVSSKHCILERKINVYDGSIEWQLKDLDSTNGCKVNGKKVPIHAYFPLKNNDIIKVGASVFRFLTPEYDYSLAHNFAGINHDVANGNNDGRIPVGSSSKQALRRMAAPLTVRNKPMLGSPSSVNKNTFGSGARGRYSSNNNSNRRLTLARRVSMTPGSIGFRYQNNHGSENSNTTGNDEEFHGGRLDFDDEYFMMNNMSNIEEEDGQMDQSVDFSRDSIIQTNNNDENQNNIVMENEVVPEMENEVVPEMENVDLNYSNNIENDENNNNGLNASTASTFQNVLNLNISEIFSPLHDNTNARNNLGSNDKNRSRRKRRSNSHRKKSTKNIEQQPIDKDDTTNSSVPIVYNTEMIEDLSINGIQQHQEKNDNGSGDDENVPSPCTDFQHLVQNMQDVYSNRIYPSIEEKVIPYIYDTIDNMQEVSIELVFDTYQGINIQMDEINNSCMELFELLSHHNISIETMYMMVYIFSVLFFCGISYGLIHCFYCDVNSNNDDMGYMMCEPMHTKFIETLQPKVDFDTLPCLAPPLPAYLRNNDANFNSYNYISNAIEEYFKCNTEQRLNDMKDYDIAAVTSKEILGSGLLPFSNDIFSLVNVFGQIVFQGRGIVPEI